jgi:hypothetical protein
MKSLSNLLHRMPWWAMIGGGFVVIAALAVFVTPYNVISYRHDGVSPEETRAIKREIDNTFAENAIDLSHNVIRAMIGATSDPARKEELSRALEELDRVRDELRDAGAEVMRAKREAVDTAREAAREAVTAIEGARQSAEEALKEAGVDNERLRQALEQSLKSAKEAEEEAKRALAEEGGKRRISIGVGAGKSHPLIDIDVGKSEPREKRRVEIGKLGDAGRGTSASITIDLDDEKPAKVPTPPAVPVPPGAPAVSGVTAPPAPPLAPELRAQIREKVSHDMYRIGIGAGLILIFIPLFILAVVAKVFIDRSRAALRLADLKRKEAEYHRMSQQVTEAKLQALQAQVEPHFLYNTLANVQALTEVDPGRANTMVGHLIQYLRNALPKMRESISSVGQEVELVRAYLNILQMRMGDRLTFDIAVPESLTAAPFPPLMLPSLVENAIKHGLEPQREGGNVHISAQAQDGRLRVTVADTGRGFADSIGTGVGLENIRERLGALYGEGAKLTLESNAAGGVIATIEVPMEGMRAQASPMAAAAAPESAPAEPKGAASKVLSVAGKVERAWRKTLSFAFVALVIVAAVLSGLAIFGVVTGFLPVQVGSEAIPGAGGALLGTAGIVLAFAVVVLVLALVVALIYGLGFMMAGIAIFIPVVILISLAPALAPVVLLGLFIWWVLSRKKKRIEAAAPKVEPVMTVQKDGGRSG